MHLKTIQFMTKGLLTAGGSVFYANSMRQAAPTAEPVPR
jgi:hypothetical protein